MTTLGVATLALLLRLALSSDLRMDLLRLVAVGSMSAFFVLLAGIAIVWQWLRLPASLSTRQEKEALGVPKRSAIPRASGGLSPLVGTAIVSAAFAGLQLLVDLTAMGSPLSWLLVVQDLLVGTLLGCALSAMNTLPTRLAMRRAIERAESEPAI